MSPSGSIDIGADIDAEDIFKKGLEFWTKVYNPQKEG